MEMRHLRYFVAVAEECHFGRAAARLHMAQPPLSQQIKQLETDLGVTLLLRTTRKVELTAAGERFLERTRQILASVDSAADEAARVAAGEIGRLAIGFTGSATYDLLPRLARVLRQEFPFVAAGLGVALVPESVRHLQITGAVYLPLAGKAVDVELAVATRREDPSPHLTRVLATTQSFIGGTR